jgi:hypothetical protein
VEQVLVSQVLQRVRQVLLVQQARRGSPVRQVWPLVAPMPRAHLVRALMGRQPWCARRPARPPR